MTQEPWEIVADVKGELWTVALQIGEQGRHDRSATVYRLALQRLCDRLEGAIKMHEGDCKRKAAEGPKGEPQ